MTSLYEEALRKYQREKNDCETCEHIDYTEKSIHSTKVRCFKCKKPISDRTDMYFHSAKEERDSTPDDDDGYVWWTCIFYYYHSRCYHRTIEDYLNDRKEFYLEKLE